MIYQMLTHVGIYTPSQYLYEVMLFKIKLDVFVVKAFIKREYITVRVDIIQVCKRGSVRKI